MITLKTATKRTGDIRKGESYVSFTGRDAEKLKSAAAFLGITPEKAGNNALLVFLEKNRVRAITSAHDGSVSQQLKD